MYDHEEDLHILQLALDQPEHDVSYTCWCDPVLIAENETTGGRTWQHKMIQ